MIKFFKLVVVICLGYLVSYCILGTVNASQTTVTAIDIVLEPDQIMIKHAEDINTRLLQVYPNGFALDEAHKPHISLLQRYVRTSDLPQLYEAVESVFAIHKVAGWVLTSNKFYYLPWQDLGLAGIVVEPTSDLIILQQKLVDVVAPYSVKIGTKDAFVTTTQEPQINQATIDYVAAFVPNQIGAHFNPHVTVGIATQTYLKKMVAEPFANFTFSAVGASVYQLGNYGTARKKLKGWDL